MLYLHCLCFQLLHTPQTPLRRFVSSSHFTTMTSQSSGSLVGSSLQLNYLWSPQNRGGPPEIFLVNCAESAHVGRLLLLVFVVILQAFSLICIAAFFGGSDFIWHSAALPSLFLIVALIRAPHLFVFCSGFFFCFSYQPDIAFVARLLFISFLRRHAGQHCPMPCLVLVRAFASTSGRRKVQGNFVLMFFETSALLEILSPW